MNPLRNLLVVVALMIVANANAQPAVYTDLGTHTTAGSFSQNVTLTAAANVQWFRIVLPAAASTDGYVDIWNSPSGQADNITDSEIGIFDNAGNLLTSDDDDGPSLYSAISFGLTSPPRPAPVFPGTTAGVNFNGRDGDLAGGIYWIGVGHFNVTFSGGWTATSTYTGTQRTTVLNFAVQPLTVMQRPVSLSVVPGDTARFSIEASTPELLEYQWLRDGAPLTDGGRFSGCTTRELVISNVSCGETGLYSVAVTSASGTVVSEPARLTLGRLVLLVCSNLNDSVAAVDPVSGQFLWYVVRPREGGLDYPNGLAIHPSGDTLVTSVFTSSLIRYPLGAPPVHYSGAGLFQPVNVTLANPDLALVAGWGSNNVVAVDLRTGQASECVAPNEGGLIESGGITIDPADGTLLVASDTVIRRYNPNCGGFIEGLSGCNLSDCTSLLFGNDGSLYATSGPNDQIVRFDSNGTCSIFAQGCGLDIAQSMAWAPDGNMLVTSFLTNQILKYGPTGQCIGIFTGGPWMARPTDMKIGVVTPDCNRNGISDVCEIAQQPSLDQNQNGVPDTCECADSGQCVTVSLVPQQGGNCIGAGLVVDINLASPQFITGGQFYLSYDTTKLDLTTDDIAVGQSPFTQLLLAAVDDAAGTADVAVSVPAGNGGATSGRMARLTFAVIDGSCTPSAGLVAFRNHVPPTRVTDRNAIPYDTENGLLVANNLPPVVLDGQPPTFPGAVGGVLPPISTIADAGLCTALVSVATPTVDDDCNTNVTVTGARSDGQPLTAPYPSTTPTTITWTAIDCAGNTATATQTVSVSAINEIDVDIAFGSAAFAGNFVRCIRFEVFPRNCTAPVIVEQNVTFTLGTAVGVVVRVPCGDYACITARDVRHSLRRTDVDNFGTTPVVDGRYRALFTNRTSTGGDDDSLVLGNLAQENNEYQYIDILDVAAVLTRYGLAAAVDTGCGFPTRHADLDADGTVGLIDLTLTLGNFTRTQEANCCGFGGVQGEGRQLDVAGAELRIEPRTEISVEELTALGLDDLVAADLNGDGMVDLGDVTAALSGTKPVVPPTAGPTGSRTRSMPSRVGP